MSTFNFDSIAVERKDDEVNIHFDGDTLGFVSTTNGFCITNDWNNRHFTLAFDENSFLYHLTREDLDGEGSGKNNLSPGEFIAELWGYVRTMAPAVPEDTVDFEFVGKLNMDSVRSHLEESSILSDSPDEPKVDGRLASEMAKDLVEDPTKLGKLFQQVLEPVDWATAKDSGEHLFVYPTVEAIYILLLYPDETVGVTTVREVTDLATLAGGSQLVDHAIRSVKRSP